MSVAVWETSWAASFVIRQFEIIGRIIHFTLETYLINAIYYINTPPGGDPCLRAWRGPRRMASSPVAQSAGRRSCRADAGQYASGVGWMVIEWKRTGKGVPWRCFRRALLGRMSGAGGRRIPGGSRPPVWGAGEMLSFGAGRHSGLFFSGQSAYKPGYFFG